MKALRVQDIMKLSLVDTDKPQPDGKNVIIKVAKAGICGSDLHILKKGDQKKDRILGHEFSGTVEDSGANKGLKLGDQVTAIPMNPCGQCPECKGGFWNLCGQNVDGLGLSTLYPGAFAQYVSVRPDMVRNLPDGVDLASGAVIEPAAVSLRAVCEAGVRIGDKVLIIGGGVIGVLVAAFARLSGASYVALCETNSSRAEKAMRFGDIDQVFDTNDSEMLSKMLGVSGGEFDKSFDCVGAGPTIATAMTLTKPRGLISLVGVSLDPVAVSIFSAVTKELRLNGSFAYLSEFDICLDLIDRGKLNLSRFISKEVSFDQVQESVEDLASGKSSDIKVLINPQL